jgi:hypothetical protein
MTDSKSPEGTGTTPGPSETKYMAIEDVIRSVKLAKGVDITEQELLSQPTTRRLVVVQGQPAISVTEEVDNGNTTLTIR